jgi:hypothetical protein
MDIPRRESASSAAAMSLIAFCACVAALTPPFSERVLEYPALVTLIALGIASSLILHLVFVGLLARAWGKAAGKYVALALFTLPVGSIVGLVLLEWHEKVTQSSKHESAA